jgi:hypothetical protein
MAAARIRNIPVKIAQSLQLIVSSMRQYVVRRTSIKISIRWGISIMGAKIN